MTAHAPVPSSPGGPRRGVRAAGFAAVLAGVLIATLLATASSAALVPTRLALSGVLVGGGFDGPIAFGTWPVGHADCAPDGSGSVCATVTSLGVLHVRPSLDGPPGSAFRAEVPLGTVTATVRVRDTTARPFRYQAASSVLTYHGRAGGLASRFALVAVAYPSQRCAGTPERLATVPAHGSATVCLAFGHGGRLAIGAGRYGRRQWASLVVGGFAEWASGRALATSPLDAGDPLPYVIPLAPPSLRWGCSTAWLVSFGCGDAPILQSQGDVRLALVDARGRRLATSPGSAVRRRRTDACDGLLASDPTASLPCGTGPLHGADVARGTTVLRVALGNRARGGYRVALVKVVADVARACTTTGCSAARLLAGSWVPGARLAGCTNGATALLSPGTAADPSRAVLCAVLPTRVGDRIDRLGVTVELVPLRPSAATRAALDGARSFSFGGLSWVVPPGPF